MTSEPLILSEHDAAVRNSLMELRATLLQAVDDVDEVLERVVETYKPLRAASKGWGEIMEAAPKPLAVTRLHQRINDIVTAGSTLRRAVIRALLEEGVPKNHIARILGITHQRLSQLSQGMEPRSPV